MPEAPRKLLVTTDLSPESECACERACALAGPGATVTLLYVVDFGSHLPGGALTLSEGARKSIWGEVRAKVEPKLQALRDRTLGACPSVELELVDGHGTARTICDYAEEHGVDLIVIATHGNGMHRHLLGSVSERVVRHATCDVLVVRSHPSA